MSAPFPPGAGDRPALVQISGSCDLWAWLNAKARQRGTSRFAVVADLLRKAMAEDVAASLQPTADVAAPTHPAIPEGWTLPPEAERPEGMRVIAMIELEWRRATFSPGIFGWYRPEEHCRFQVAAGEPGVHGFAPLPDPAKGGAA